MLERFFAPCPRGLETLLAEELTALGAEAVEADRGGVHFRGDWRAAYRANLESRVATRILWRVGSNYYRNEDDVYRLAHGIAWEKWMTTAHTLRVQVTAKRSPLRSLEFITLRIKDAVCDRFRDRTGQRPSVDTAAPDMRIHAFLDAHRAHLYLDLSGDPLVRRGFKRASVEAPLKENLAAGILKLTGWQPSEPLVDPMCGSGTFLLEAAMMALNIAPGMGRNFALEKMRHFNAPLWQEIVAVAKAAERPRRALAIHGADISAQETHRTQINLRVAGLADCVTVTTCDILELPAPAPVGVMVANPPYGVRLGEAEALAAFYPRLGDALKAHWAGWRCHFLSADENLPKLIRLKSSGRTPLYNGALECRLYEYRMVAGSNQRRKASGGEAGQGGTAERG